MTEALVLVITSYSIHYTKLYDVKKRARLRREDGAAPGDILEIAKLGWDVLAKLISCQVAVKPWRHLESVSREANCGFEQAVPRQLAEFAMRRP